MEIGNHPAIKWFRRDMSRSVEKERTPVPGMATAYLQALKATFPGLDTNVVLQFNHNCPGGCGHCIAKGNIIEERKKRLTLGDIGFAKLQRIKRNKMRDLIVSFQGADTLTLTGGEPLLEEDAIDFIGDAAASFKLVYVTTNAVEIPGDEAQAIVYLRQFPPNVCITFSIDEFHEQAFPDTVKKIRLLNRLIKEQKDGIKCSCAYNIRVSNREQREDPKALLDPYGIYEEYNADRIITAKRQVKSTKFFVHTIRAHGAAVGNHHATPIEVKELKPEDIIEHTQDPNKMIMYITPDGEFVTSDHVADMVHKPKIGIIGNVFQEGFEGIATKIIHSHFNGRKDIIFQEFVQLKLAELYGDEEKKAVILARCAKKAIQLTPEVLSYESDSERELREETNRRLKDQLIDAIITESDTDIVFNLFDDDRIRYALSHMSKEEKKATIADLIISWTADLKNDLRVCSHDGYDIRDLLYVDKTGDRKKIRTIRHEFRKDDRTTDSAINIYKEMLHEGKDQQFDAFLMQRISNNIFATCKLLENNFGLEYSYTFLHSLMSKYHFSNDLDQIEYLAASIISDEHLFERAADIAKTEDLQDVSAYFVGNKLEEMKQRIQKFKPNMDKFNCGFSTIPYWLMNFLRGNDNARYFPRSLLTQSFA
jgi:MoaA/NifB/PqqE/SkfB family radical SAM enzyme